MSANTVLLPGDDFMVPKEELKFESPRYDVPESWEGIYLWNLARQESPNRDIFFFAIATVLLMSYFAMMHVACNEIFKRYNGKYRSLKE